MIFINIYDLFYHVEAVPKLSFQIIFIFIYHLKGNEVGLLIEYNKSITNK